jgi:hypothetical protein
MLGPLLWSKVPVLARARAGIMDITDIIMAITNTDIFFILPSLIAGG